MEEHLDKFLSRYTKTISEIVGEQVPAKGVLTRKEIGSLHRKMDSTFTLAVSTFHVDWKNVAPEEIRDRLHVFFDKMLRLHYRIPRGEKALPWIQRELDEVLHPKPDTSYQRIFYEISEASGWLIGELFKNNRITEAQSFFSKFTKSQEAFSLAQIYVQRLLPTFQKLGGLEEQELGKRHIQALIGHYSVLSGVYEKLCRIVVVLNRIRTGQDSDYDNLGWTTLAPILKEMEREKSLKPIASKTSVKVRNSIAHPSYRIYYSKRRIRFDRELDMTWNQFRKKTVELSIALLALTITPFLHYLRDILELLEHALSPSVQGQPPRPSRIVQKR